MRMRSSLLALLFTAPLAAQAVGSEAPDIVWRHTFQFGEIPAKKLSDLRGSVVVLVFWTTQSAPCKPQIAPMNTFFAKKAEEGLVVVGVTDEHEKTVAAYLEPNGVKYPVGIGNIADYAIAAVPHAFLIDDDGKVLWHGHPSALEYAAVDKALVGARPAIVLPGLEEVQAMRRAKDYGAAYARAKNLLAGGTLSERATAQARFWMQEYETFVTAALASADQALADKDIYRQWAALQPVADWYQGVPGADAGKARFTTLMADPKAKKEIEAGKKFAVVKEKEAASEFDAAYAGCKEIVALFATTKVGKEANALMKAYEKDGKLGYDASCGYCKAGGAACPQHRKKKK